MNATIAARPNAEFLEEFYDKWKEDPESVDAEWRAFFEGFEIGMSRVPDEGEDGAGNGLPTTVTGELKTSGAKAEPGEGTGPLMISGEGEQFDLAFRAKVVSAVFQFRAIGHTAAWVDPLAKEAPEQPALGLAALGLKESDLTKVVRTQFFEKGHSMPLGTLFERLRATYCDRTGFEFMHIQDKEVRHWVRDKVEARMHAGEPDKSQRIDYLTWLLEGQYFEEFLHQKYVGQKRFSLEGAEGALVALHTIFEGCPSVGLREIVMGMAHRGRLNVLANFLQKPLKVLLNEFSENYVPNMVGGDGDVKYHLGYETSLRTETGDEVGIFLAANPSHLEAVNAVVEGKARARQRIVGDTERRKAVLPVLLHGDAAFAGQGSVAEVLNLSQLPGYRTGGTIHVIINNQIGFTTTPEDARSSTHCTDVAKMVEAPVFHVNGDYPEEVAYAAELALEFRQTFGRDVVIDVVCYRRHGHNESDEPSFTQPTISKSIREQRPVAQLYKERLVDSGAVEKEVVLAIENHLNARLETELQELQELQEKGERDAYAGSNATHQGRYWYDTVQTGIGLERFRELGKRLNFVPEDFKIHPTIKRRFLAAREKAVESGGPFDWAHAEALAFASLLVEKKGVRLSGQDCRRGTFSQRHSFYYDQETREPYVPLKNLEEGQALFCAYNSLLSETAVLGFDYGYSLMEPELLICWEAQFGDFANGAQMIIDQFISSAESKWGRASGITLLLPHGYEGQGPEHSSARLERFLQMCAEGNMQVCNLTTPSQYFHVLRRQLHRENYRKPLVIMTPKSLLRHPQAVSFEEEMTGGTSFREVLDDEQLIETPGQVTRLIFCSGKVYYDLLKFRNDNKLRNVAIIRMEQLYPFHWGKVKEILSRYTRDNKKLVWCQEEPLNMGAWSYIGPRIEEAADNTRLRYAGRARAASPAAGSKAVHVREQAKLVEDAFHV